MTTSVCTSESCCTSCNLIPGELKKKTPLDRIIAPAPMWWGGEVSMPSIDNPLPLLRKGPESPVSAVLRQIEASLSAGKTRKAMEQCQQALTLSNNMADVCDFALAQAYKAHIHSLLKQQREGDKTAEQAIRRLRLSGDKHNEAITYLIHALIHHRAGAVEEARSAYETGRDHLEKLYRQALAAGNRKQANKYGELAQQVRKRLEQIAQAIAEHYITTETDQVSRVSWVSGDALHFLPVIGPIPAGQARVSTDDIQDIVTVVDQATIDDVRYYFKNLYDRGDIIKLDPREYDYYLSRVISDSMDRAEIEEGDYVVLRRSRNLPVSPSPRDIVAASIIDVDREATLKRYIKQGSTIVLRPESSNPEHQPYESREGDEGVTIVAVAIAVLKPAE